MKINTIEEDDEIWNSEVLHTIRFDPETNLFSVVEPSPPEPEILESCEKEEHRQEVGPESEAQKERIGELIQRRYRIRKTVLTKRRRMPMIRR